ncbi:hypothetical protein N9D31_03755 [Oligoflexaceae bacterium]|nr:hypothetical protein [Oligoflexaceae bacterium]
MKFLIISVFFFSSVYAQAGTVEYKLPAFGGQGTESQCLLKLRRAARVFQRVSGATVSSYHCKIDNFDPHVRSGYIVYSALRAAPIHTLLNHGLESERDGIYANKSQCQQEIIRIVGIYTEKTGLRPHAAWCYPTADSQWKKFAIQIHSVGYSDVYRYVVGADIDGPLCCSPTAAIQRIYKSLKINFQDLYTIRLNITNETEGRHVRLEYLSDKRRLLHTEKSIYAKTKNECTQLANTVSKALDDRILSTFCIKNESSSDLPFQVNILSFSSNSFQSDGYTLWQLPESHEQLYQCEAVLSSVTNSLRPVPLFGACALSELGKYSIFVAN